MAETKWELRVTVTAATRAGLPRFPGVDVAPTANEASLNSIETDPCSCVSLAVARAFFLCARRWMEGSGGCAITDANIVRHVFRFVLPVARACTWRLEMDHFDMLSRPVGVAWRAGRDHDAADDPVKLVPHSGFCHWGIATSCPGPVVVRLSGMWRTREWDTRYTIATLDGKRLAYWHGSIGLLGW